MCMIRDEYLAHVIHCVSLGGGAGHDCRALGADAQYLVMCEVCWRSTPGEFNQWSKRGLPSSASEGSEINGYAVVSKVDG